MANQPQKSKVNLPSDDRLRAFLKKMMNKEKYPRFLGRLYDYGHSSLRFNQKTRKALAKMIELEVELDAALKDSGYAEEMLKIDLEDLRLRTEFSNSLSGLMHKREALKVCASISLKSVLLVNGILIDEELLGY